MCIQLVQGTKYTREIREIRYKFKREHIMMLEGRRYKPYQHH